ACNAGLLPLMLGSDSAVLDLGLSRRLFDRYQRIALAVRDRGCVFPGCDRPPAWTEAHHITGWQDGGPTDMANGCLLCNFHHHLVHRGDWAVVMASDGVPEILPPARIDPDRQPRRHQRLRPQRE
ncbi:MAG: HNH endonuclease, partial [Nocardioidaceae bacterium]|nr:HNH endonuclease [Nocardioidaceae bacterium]